MTDQGRIDELERELSAAKGALATVRAERDAFACARGQGDGHARQDALLLMRARVGA